MGEIAHAKQRPWLPHLEFYKFVRAQQPPGAVPPVASTDGVNFDRQPTPQERAALLAFLQKQ